MYNNIVVPVDLRHLDQLERALSVAADLARHYEAKLTFVSATPSAPSSVAHSPEEFAKKLEEFANSQAEKEGITAASHVFIVNDVTADLDHHLLQEIKRINPDLVVMASHRPGAGDYFWSSHGGSVASHAPASVMLVREDV